MKKILLAITLYFFFLLSFSGCNAENPENDEPIANVTQVSAIDVDNCTERSIQIESGAPIYYWTIDSSSIIFADPSLNDQWYRYVISTGETEMIPSDQVSRLTGIDINNDFERFNLPTESHIVSISPSRNALVYSTIVEYNDILPTPFTSPTITPTFDPIIGPAHEQWNGEIFMVTLGIHYSINTGQSYYLGNVQGDNLSVFWFPTETGAVMIRQVSRHIGDFTSPPGFWILDFSNSTIQQIQFPNINNIDRVFGISPGNRLLLYTIGNDQNLYSFNLETEEINTYTVNVSNGFWWDRSTTDEFWYLSSQNEEFCLSHYSLNNASLRFSSDTCIPGNVVSTSQALSPNGNYFIYHHLISNEQSNFISELIINRICR